MLPDPGHEEPLAGPAQQNVVARSMTGLARFGRHLVSTYLTFDPRSLGVFRIALGLVLLYDLTLRWRGLEYWYADGGLVPTHLIESSRFEYVASLFEYASTPSQAAFGMVLCGVVYSLFTLGLATRVTHLLSIVAVTSLLSRLFVLENSGHAVLTLVVIWSAFLPLGRRFSLDASIARWRARRTREPFDIAVRQRPVVSLAVLALLLQFSAIYWFSYVQKTGKRWHEGSAVHYVLHDERMNTSLAVWTREHVPYPVLRVATWGTLALEALAPLLLLSPLWPQHFRLGAIVLLPGLHLAFAAFLTLGIFSYAMSCFFFLLIAPSHWDWLGRRPLIRRAKRFFARLAESPPVRTAEAATSRDDQPHTWWRWLSYPRIAVREIAIIVLAAACIGDLALRNPAWPDRLKLEQPQLFQALIWYPRIRQYWRMFTPGPMESVVGLAVEAITEDGRIVDPYNEVAGRHPRLSRESIPERWGQDQPFSDYTARLSQPGFEWCHMAFINWVLAYPSRTGNPTDRIVSFRAYRVEASMPPPGSKEFGRPIFDPFLAFP